MAQWNYNENETVTTLNYIDGTIKDVAYRPGPKSKFKVDRW